MVTEKYICEKCKKEYKHHPEALYCCTDKDHYEDWLEEQRILKEKLNSNRRI